MKALFFAVFNLAIAAYAQTTAMMDMTTDMMTMMDSTTGASDTVIPKTYSPVYSLVFKTFLACVKVFVLNALSEIIHISK